MIIISVIFSISLNLQSISCLTQLAQLYNSGTGIDRTNNTITDPTIIDLQRNCFIITNSYVFSLFGIIIGVIIIIVGWKKTRAR